MILQKNLILLNNINLLKNIGIAILTILLFVAVFFIIINDTKNG